MLYNRKTGKALGYTQEDRIKATSVSLIALASSLGYTPVRVGKYYSLKEFDSVIIYNDATWYRWSGNGKVHGGSQIDFMLEFGPAESAVEAIDMLLKFRNVNYDTESNYVNNSIVNNSHKTNEADDKVLKLPPHNKDYKRIYAYLMQTRGLSQDVVSYFIHNKLIYEDAIHHNIVYCGYDPDGKIRYAGMRGTGDIYGRKFKCDCEGNDKNYGVNIVNKDSDELCVFEAVIDCMSYIDLTGDYTSNKLVLGMVADNPLKQFLNDYSHIRKINFCLDNDKAAHKALYVEHGLMNKYSEAGYECRVTVPESGKDFNEALLNRKNNAAMTPNLTEQLQVNHRKAR